MTPTHPAGKGAALVTGASKRIGRALAEALVEDGYALAVHYNASRAEADAFVAAIEAKGGRATALGADLADPEAAAGLIDAARAALGPVSVLVNSASVFEDDAVGTITAASFRRHMDANTLAPALLSQAFAAQAPDRPGGAMIFNLLDYKLFNMNADFFSYTLSKAALMTMTQMLARSLAPKVRVNAAAPGLTMRAGAGGSGAHAALFPGDPVCLGTDRLCGWRPAFRSAPDARRVRGAGRDRVEASRGRRLRRSLSECLVQQSCTPA